MLGELISAGTSLLGGLFGQSAARDRQRQEMQLAQQQMAMQREFAQQGVRWRVADAKAAGVHPLFALGAQTHSYSPQTVGGSSDNSMGDAIASAGQNIGRAVQAGMTADERKKADVVDALTLEKAGLENELLRTQIGSLKQKQLGPAMPGSKAGGVAGPLTLLGQGDADRVVNMPHGLQITPRKNESPAEKLEDEYGEVADVIGAYRLLKDSGIALGDYGNTLRDRIYEWQRRNRPNAAHVPMRHDRERGTYWSGRYGYGRR